MQLLCLTNTCSPRSTRPLGQHAYTARIFLRIDFTANARHSRKTSSTSALTAASVTTILSALGQRHPSLHGNRTQIVSALHFCRPVLSQTIHLHLHGLPGGQPTDVMLVLINACAEVKPLDFINDERGFRRLGVRDVDGVMVSCRDMS